MVKAMGGEATSFIQSRLGELRASEARYEDPLGEADKAYPAYLKTLAEYIK